MKDYTVKEIADLLKVSKTTIQKAIKAAAIEYDYIEKNRQYYTAAKAKEIILIVRPSFEFALLENETENLTTKTENSCENQTENLKTQTEKSTTQTENLKTTLHSEEIATMNRMLEMIQKQLDEKDKQLEMKDKQIQDLSDRLAEAMQLTKGQQYIAAADKTAQLIEAEQQQADEIIETAAEHPKKSFFSKLFGK